MYTLFTQPFITTEEVGGFLWVYLNELGRESLSLAIEPTDEHDLRWVNALREVLANALNRVENIIKFTKGETVGEVRKAMLDQFHEEFPPSP